MSYKIKSKYGYVYFSAEGTPSQCGVTFIHNVTFGDVKDKKKLYEFFLNEVILGTENLKSVTGDDWGYETVSRGGRFKVNKYLMTDYKREEFRHGKSEVDKAHLYDFCKVMKALEGDLVPNPNSGNQVRSFEFNRKMIDEDKLDGKSAAQSTT